MFIDTEYDTWNMDPVALESLRDVSGSEGRCSRSPIRNIG